MPKHEWRVFNVSGYPSHTIGYVDGDRLENNMPVKLTAIEAEGWEVFSVNIASSTNGFIVARRQPVAPNDAVVQVGATK